MVLDEDFPPLDRSRSSSFSKTTAKSNTLAVETPAAHAHNRRRRHGIATDDDDCALGPPSPYPEDEDDAAEDYEMYDELGRTPPRTRLSNNRKWKDNKKLMGELEQ